MAGIYIHIPFCASKCVYCDFFSCTRLDQRDAVLDATLEEMRTQRGYLGGEPVSTLYIGGGTPSLSPPARLQHFIDTARELWNCSALGEITVEANPDDMSPRWLEELAATDVDRLSIGVQSFFDAHLAFMGRRHRGRAAAEAVERAQQFGFGNISIDLIYGVPGMNIGEWERNLDTALSLGVQHISAYHLTVEPGTPLGCSLERGMFRVVEESASEEQFRMLHRKLTSAGFEHYEVSNFARRGFRSRHNSSYWDGSLYLGVGPSAHSYDGSSRRSCPSSLDDYLRPGAIRYETERLSRRDRYNEYIMTSLRRAEGVDMRMMEQSIGEDFAERFRAGIRKFTDAGTVIADGASYRIRPEDFLISDGVIRDLFETE